MKNTGAYYNEPLQSSMPIQQKMPQRSVRQREDIHGFDEYDEEDFGRGLHESSEYRSNYHY